MINELGLSAPFKSVLACRPPRNLPLSFDERDLETEQPLLLPRQISTLPAVLQGSVASFRGRFAKLARCPWSARLLVCSNGANSNPK